MMKLHHSATSSSWTTTTRHLFILLVILNVALALALTGPAVDDDSSSSSSGSDASQEDDVPLERVSVSLGRTAELPCDISPPPLDSLYLVLWYKNDSDFPIYKYDARRSRESYRQQQQHDGDGPYSAAWPLPASSNDPSNPHSDSTTAWRMHFQFDSHPAVLQLQGVSEHDEGFYRCRVDFGRSPTRHRLVQLSVVVPPQKLRIIDNNREVSSVIGPFDEGAQLSLNCIVSGGRPRPEVTWWLDERLLDQTFVATSESVVQNVLVIGQLERRHLHANLRCQASNAAAITGYNSSASSSSSSSSTAQTTSLHILRHHQQQQQHYQLHTLVSSVQLDLNLRPSSVWISGADKPMSAGKSYLIECTASGSRPAATIRWYLRSAQQPAKEKIAADGSNTTSVMKLTPTFRDHETELICSAANPQLLLTTTSTNASAASIEIKKKLNVHFSPSVELELGRNLNPDAIVEGNDVYFECRIRSNPPPTRVIWTHEGQSIRENVSAGVLIVGQGLVIRGVSRQQSGRYGCTAINAEGSGTSNAVQLKVMYLPTCRPGQKHMYGVAKHETVKVTCQTDSIPQAVAYRWTFNASTSTDMMELHSASGTQQYLQSNTNGAGASVALVNQPEANGDGSVLAYTPQSDKDYGTLLCWARNDIGEQREPCLFRIFLAVRPDPPINCTVTNQTADSVEVWCRPGFDGGHAQQFQFEIFDTQSAVLLYNKSGRYPHLRVGNLESGLKLFIQVSAFNLRGRSALVPLEAYTVKIADKQTVIMETTDLASVLGIVSGVSASLGLICVAIALTARFRHAHHRHQRQRNNNQQDATAPSDVPGVANTEIKTAQVDLIKNNSGQPDCCSEAFASQQAGIDASPQPWDHCDTGGGGHYYGTTQPWMAVAVNAYDKKSLNGSTSFGYPMVEVVTIKTSSHQFNNNTGQQHLPETPI